MRSLVFFLLFSIFFSCGKIFRAQAKKKKKKKKKNKNKKKIKKKTKGAERERQIFFKKKTTSAATTKKRMPASNGSGVAINVHNASTAWPNQAAVLSML
jgi:hypothetical protein